MRNKKIKIAAIVIAVLLIGSNTTVFACSDITGCCTGDTTGTVEKNIVISLPNVPEIPPIPTTTTIPNIPDIPETPVIPVIPVIPEIPEAPVIPVIPVIPGIPEAPVIPVIPDIPDIPETPVIPVIPVIPDIPETPVIPVIPNVPEIPEIPDIPPLPPIPSGNLTTKVVNPVNGDIIETSFDPSTQATTSNMICSRKDAPDILTITGQSGTDTTMTGDGDSFNCEAGYYGNSVSPVNLAADYKSSLNINLKNSSVMSGKINENNKIQNVSLTLDKTSKWIVEGTSYLSALTVADSDLSNIVDNGNTIYYDSSNAANDWLDGKTYTLAGGGKLIPLN
ncbi:MAG TPA: hypothetical protein VHT96_06820 [Clostridia bacterium]|nr:hypothetical protein [Clostridia bacterium]